MQTQMYMYVLLESKSQLLLTLRIYQFKLYFHTIHIRCATVHLYNVVNKFSFERYTADE